jgi:hypothetical protein
LPKFLALTKLAMPRVVPGHAANLFWAVPLVLVSLGAAGPWTDLERSTARSENSAHEAVRNTPVQSKAAAKVAPETADHEDGPLKPFDDFWSVGELKAGIDIGKKLAAQTHQKNVDLQFLIAIVPDPIDSRFAYRFDGIIDAIGDAVEYDRWNLDHFWLPWYPSGEQPESRERLKSALEADTGAALERSAPSRKETSILDSLIAEARDRLREAGTKKAMRPMQELEPGALLFRKREKSRDRLLMVLLVGETPTTGIHKRAFFKCLNIVHAYHGEGRVGSGTAINFPILGPCYSGAEQSLSFTISRWLADYAGHEQATLGTLPVPPRQAELPDKPVAAPDEPPKVRWSFQIVTGEANEIDKTRFEQTATGGRKTASVDFSATVAHFDDVMTALFRFLMRQNGGRPLGKVALLTESDTAFGKSIDRWSGALSSQNSAQIQITQMKFPFHVSQVAVALDEEGRKIDRNTPSLVRPSSRLTIPFDETGSPRDTVPALSPQMSTATSEFVLGKIFETISEEDFRYIGIVATDTRDTIFLAGLIHQFCPDVQVFVPDGDLLLAHPRYSPQLRGMILASSYPLYSMVQRWEPPYKGDRRRHLFSSQDAEGAYNATLMLLHRREIDPRGEMPRAAIEPGTDKNRYLYEALVDYGRPFQELKQLSWFWSGSGWHRSVHDVGHSIAIEDNEVPPIWFSMVGTRGLWPLGFDDGRRDKSPDDAKQPDVSGRGSYVHELAYQCTLSPSELVAQFIPLVPQFTWHWSAVFLGLTAFAWLLIGVHLRYLLSKSGDEAHGGRHGFKKLLGLYGESGNSDPRIARARDGYIVAGLFVLLVTYLFVVASPCWIVLRYSPWALFSPHQFWWQLSSYDRWSWIFSALAIFGGYATFVSIALTFLGRAVGFVNRLINITDQLTSRPIGNLSADSRRKRRVIAAPAAALALSLLLALAVYAVPALWSLFALKSFASAWSEPEALNEAGNQLLYYERAIALNSGVSPMMPILILTFITGLWLMCQLTRLYYAERFWEKGGDRFDPGAGPAGERIKLIQWHRERIMRLTVKVLPRTVDKLVDAAPSPLVFFMLVFASGVLIFVLVRQLYRMIPSVDFQGFTPLVLFWIWFLVVTVIIALLRFLWLWKAIEDLLRFFTSLPMLSAYSRVPPALSRTFGRYLGQFRLRRLGLAIPVQQWLAVARGFDDLRAPICRAMYDKDFGLLENRDANVFVRVEQSIKGQPHSDRPCARTSLQAASDIQAQFFKDTSENEAGESDDVATSETWSDLRRAAIDCLHILVPYWRSTRVSEQFDGAPGGEPASGSAALESDGPASSGHRRAQNPVQDPLIVWMQSVEDLVALRVVAFISQGAVHLRNLGAYLAVAPALLLLAISSYPLAPQRFMIVLMWAVLLLVVVTGVTVVIQMERNEFLSRVSRTKPDKIAFDPTFVMNVLAFVLPLLIATLAQFPFVSDTILQWLEPITRVLR